MKKIVIAYVPVIHAGYKKFFKRHADADEWYVFGTDVIQEFDYLRKEIRALAPEEIVTLLSAFFDREVVVLDRAGIDKLKGEECVIHAPREDVVENFIDKNLDSKKVEYDPLFLRWNRTNALEKKDIDCDKSIKADDLEKEIFSTIYSEADKVGDWWLQVGAMIVRDGEPLLWGHNRYNQSQHKVWSDGDPRNSFWKGVNAELTTSLHAERGLIAEAAKQGIPLEGTSMYVTHFPCPTCAKMIVASGISKLYFAEGYSILDGVNVLREAGVEVIKVEGIDVSEKGDEFLEYPERKK